MFGGFTGALDFPLRLLLYFRKFNFSRFGNPVAFVRRLAFGLFLNFGYLTVETCGPFLNFFNLGDGRGALLLRAVKITPESLPPGSGALAPIEPVAAAQDIERQK